MSISIDRGAAAAIREAAKEAGSSVSAFVEQVALEAVQRKARLRELFAEWDDEDAAIQTAADQMSPSDAWSDGEQMTADEDAELRNQLARIEARWRESHSA